MRAGEIVRLPEDCPFGVGPVLVIEVPRDACTIHGNVIVAAGTYEAVQSKDAPEGNVTVFSPEHYSGHAIYAGLSVSDWVFPGEKQRPIPAHDCDDHLRSAIAGDTVYCGICRRTF